MTITIPGHRFEPAPQGAAADEQKKTIVIYSPDLNFCDSLSMLFQDRYNVATTTNLEMLENSVSACSADLVLVDAGPSQRMLRHIEEMKGGHPCLPIIMLYVYNAKDVALDKAIRDEVDSVFYKPFEIGTVSQRVDDLLKA